MAARKSVRKATKKGARKAGKKPVPKTAKKAAKKAQKKAGKKAAGKVTKKPAKKAVRKSAKKPIKKTSKKSSIKKTSRKSSALKKTASGKRPAKESVHGTGRPSGKLSERTRAGGRKAAAKKSAGLKTAARKAAVVRFSGNGRQSVRSRRKGNIVHPPFGQGHWLSARTPVGWKATVTRLRGFSPKELQELHDHYEPRSVTIRAAVAADYPAISVLLSHAFNGPAEDNMVKSLRAGDNMICELVGEYHGVIVGYVAFIRIAAEMDGRPVDVAGLAPLAVESAFRGLGIGRRLVVGGLPEARAAGAEAVFVLGEPTYYAAMGFSTKPVQRFDSPYPAQKLSVIEFSPGSLAGRSGKLRYPAPFDAN